MERTVYIDTAPEGLFFSPFFIQAPQGVLAVLASETDDLIQLGKYPVVWWEPNDCELHIDTEGYTDNTSLRLTAHIKIPGSEDPQSLTQILDPNPNAGYISLLLGYEMGVERDWAKEFKTAKIRISKLQKERVFCCTPFCNLVAMVDDFGGPICADCHQHMMSQPCRRCGAAVNQLCGSNDCMDGKTTRRRPILTPKKSRRKLVCSHDPDFCPSPKDHPLPASTSMGSATIQ